MGDPVEPLRPEEQQQKRYRTIVADPPWEVRTGPAEGMKDGWIGGTGRNRPLAYPTMSVAEIAALPVADLARKDAHLYLWTINRYVREAFDVAAAWGFNYSTLITWAKAPMGGGLGGAFGISTEHVLFCRRGSLKSTGRVTGTWFQWKRPYDRNGWPIHSSKPDGLMDIVEQVSPGPYLELFSRRARFGWDTWGDEALGGLSLASPVSGGGVSRG